MRILNEMGLKSDQTKTKYIIYEKKSKIYHLKSDYIIKTC